MIKWIKGMFGKECKQFGIPEKITSYEEYLIRKQDDALDNYISKEIKDKYVDGIYLKVEK